MFEAKKCMRYFSVVVIILVCVCTLVAQQSPSHVKRKTFVVRKSKTSTTETAVEQKTTTLLGTEVPTKTATNWTKSTTKDSLAEVTIAPSQLPTLAGSSNFGVLDIRPYRPEMTLRNYEYVVLQYTITKYGWVNQIKLYDASTKQLADSIIKELRKTKWNAALDATGNPMDYELYKQIVIVKTKNYEK